MTSRGNPPNHTDSCGVFNSPLSLNSGSTLDTMIFLGSFSESSFFSSLVTALLSVLGARRVFLGNRMRQFGRRFGNP